MLGYPINRCRICFLPSLLHGGLKSAPEVQSLDQQHWHHPGVLRNAASQAPPRPPEPTLELGPALCVLPNPLGDSDTCSSLP